MRNVVVFSWILAVLVWVTIGLTLSALDRQGPVWAYLKPDYGLVQRSLFAAWFTWCAGAGLLIFTRERQVRTRASYV